MHRGLSLIPVVIHQRAFQNAYLGLLLLELLEHLFHFGVAQLYVALILTILVKLHCEEVLRDFVEEVLLCGEVHDPFDFRFLAVSGGLTMLLLVVSKGIRR